MRGVKNYIHRPIKGYPTDIDYICSDEGYGANPYIETTKPLVVRDRPRPRQRQAGHLPLAGVSRDRRGVLAGYAKFETFPIWNLPLKHPVNLAYEAATADLADVNMIDPFHLEAYGETTVNYNRDVEAFPIVRNILSRITGDESVYKSPTDMGVNMVGLRHRGRRGGPRGRQPGDHPPLLQGRRATTSRARASEDAVDKIKHIMQQLGVTPDGPRCGRPGSCKKQSVRRGRRGHPAAGRPRRHRQGQQPDERLLVLRC